jgi:FKBP-type peptidyl-prolyl cis-trans isomerase FkpA
MVLSSLTASSPAVARQLRITERSRQVMRWLPSLLLCALANVPACDGLAPGALLDRRKWCGQLVASGAVAYPAAALAEDGRKKLEFVELADGVKIADIALGDKGEAEVEPTSKVTFHVVGRLAGKQGWTFEDSKSQEDDPYRLELGKGKVVKGLEEGMLGMRVGGRRRIVIPSTVGYLDRSLVSE